LSRSQLLLLLLLSSPACLHAHAADATLPPTPALFRLTHETLKLPASETMGLAGGTLLFDSGEHLALGGGAYAAMGGKRGGFITLGVAAEARQQLSDNLAAHAGLFVGGGGGHGGFYLSGGGLMLRSHLGLSYRTGIGDLGAGLSYNDFPDGSIHSLQPYLAYQIPFATLLASGWMQLPAAATPLAAPAIAANEQELKLLLRSYAIPRGVKTDAGGIQHPSMGLVGVEWNYHFDDHLYLRLNSEAATIGKSQGYMEIFTGAGYRQPLTDAADLRLSAALGTGGGGGVDTGSGVLLEGELALQQRLGNRFLVELEGGYLWAPQGSFRARSLAAKIGSRFATPAVGNAAMELDQLGDFAPIHGRVRTVVQSYRRAAPNWRQHHAEQSVELLGIQLDYFPLEHLYLTGEGIAAVRGMAGAYMTGLLGAGLHLPFGEIPFFVDVEGVAGAAGGGGIATGGGLIWQANANLGWQIDPSYALLLGGGRIQARSGPFKANVLSLALGYNFTTFAR